MVQLHEFLFQYGPRYDWDESIQGLIIGSYFWGYVISSAPGGFIAEWLGPFNTIFYTQIVTAIFNSLSVWGAQWHFGFLIFFRFIIGLMAVSNLKCIRNNSISPNPKHFFRVQSIQLYNV